MIISLFSILITAISSICWGGFDGVRKHLTQKLSHWNLLFFLSAFFSIFFLVWLLTTDSYHFTDTYIKYGLITIVLNFFANYVYIKAIEFSDISSAVPFLAFTSLFTALSSFLILGEELSFIQILGILLVVISSLFINYKVGSSLKTVIEANQGALLMIVVSLLWAISAPFDKLAVAQSNVMTHSFLQSIVITFLNLSMIANLALKQKKNIIRFTKEELTRDFLAAPKSLIAGSFIAASALSLQFYAYTLMPVSIFESLKRSIAIISAFIISRIFFKEQISLMKIIATLMIITGAGMILNGG